VIVELGPVAGDWGDCGPGSRSSLDDPSVRERVSELGLELQSVLARATGEFTSTLRWPASGATVSAAPESGDVPVTVRVNYSGGAAAYVKYVYEGDVGDARVFEDPSCPEHVAVDVSVEVQTEGGALDERFDAVLLMAHRFGQIRYRVPLRSLRGSLSLSPPPAEAGNQTILGPELDFRMRVSELGTSGELSVMVHEFTNGEERAWAEDSLPMRQFAGWPAVADCAPRQLVAPIERGIDGVSPLRISELIATQAAPFTWADGSETTLLLSPRPRAGGSCAYEDRRIIHWNFDADVSAVTADGVLSGPRSGTVHLVLGADRVLGVFDMGGSSSRDELLGLLHAPAASVNDYDSGFVDFDVSHVFAWPSEQPIGSEGHLSIVAAPPPACDSEECDVRFTLAEGRVPASAAPPE